MRTQEAAYMPVESFGIGVHDAPESLLLLPATEKFYDSFVSHFYLDSENERWIKTKIEKNFLYLLSLHRLYT